MGSATAGALAGMGIRADLLPPEFRGAALPAAMAPHLRPGARVLMARAEAAGPAAAEGLRSLGVQVDDLVAYRTVMEAGDAGKLREALANGGVDYITFTSSSTVQNLLRAVGGPGHLAGARIACIGPETADTARTAGLNVHLQARTATIEGLVEVLVEDVKNRR